jgi:hypothetical protein
MSDDFPATPMRRRHVEPFVGRRIKPSAYNATAGHNEGVEAIFVNDRKFEVTAKWGAVYRLPHRLMCHWPNEIFNQEVYVALAPYHDPDRVRVLQKDDPGRLELRPPNCTGALPRLREGSWPLRRSLRLRTTPPCASPSS